MPAQGLITTRPTRIGVVRALPGLGDFLCAVPAFRALRGAFPQARIEVIGLPHTGQLVERFSKYVDGLVEFPGYPGIPEAPVNLQTLAAFVREVRRAPYDVVLQMHGDGSFMNGFCLSLGCRETFGFYRPAMPCPDPARFLPYPSDEPEVRRNLRLVQTLGAASGNEQLEFPLSPLDLAELDELPFLRGLEAGAYAVLHPGASEEDKRWAPDHFALVGDRLAADGLTVLITGTPSERPLCAQVAEEMQLECMNIAGLTSLGALAALVSGAVMVVANDTGVSHLAAALAVPSIVVFTNSDPGRWAPLDAERHRIVSRDFPGVRMDGSLLSSEALFLGERVMTPMDPVQTEVPLDRVMAEVEDLLAMGGSDVS